MKQLKYIEKEKTETICVIDGITFEQPKTWEEICLVGMVGLILLVSLPIWIWVYLAGKIIKAVSTKKQITTKYRKLICPICKIPTISGEYSKEICDVCGWYEYTREI